MAKKKNVILQLREEIWVESFLYNKIDKHLYSTRCYNQDLGINNIK